MNCTRLDSHGGGNCRAHAGNRCSEARTEEENKASIMKRYHVIKTADLDGKDTFRIHDSEGEDPLDALLPLIYLTEEPAQIDARRLNWALGV